MAICEQCEDQVKKSRNGKPHECLVTVDDPRIYGKTKSQGFAEQDYRCLTCAAKFTQSTNKNDMAWTLWQG